MTGWIIFGAVVLFIMIILWQSVTVTFDYENKLSLKVKFLWFTIFTTDPKPKKKKKPKKARKQKAEKKKNLPKNTPKDKPAEGTPADSIEKTADEPSDVNKKSEKQKPPKKEKPKLDIDLDMIMDFVRSATPPIKRLFKKIRWYDVYVDWVVGSDDAAKTALNYGRICGVLYPFFEWLTTYFTAHVKEVNVEADFSKEKSDIFAYFVLKLRLSTALACVIWLAVRVLKAYFKYSDRLSPAPSKKGK